MNTSIIILTKPWTNPETGVEHQPGDVVLIPSYLLTQEMTNGLYGKWRQPAPWEPDIEIGGKAPVKQPRSPLDPPEEPATMGPAAPKRTPPAPAPPSEG